MQFYSGSTNTNTTSGNNQNLNFEDNFHQMMAQHQQLMQLFYNCSVNGLNTPYLQTPHFYNQKQTDSYIVVNVEDCKSQNGAASTALSSDCSEASYSRAKNNAIQYNEQSPKPIKLSHDKNRSLMSKKRKTYESQEEYSPEEEQLFDYCQPKISQSKNIPKIFGKGILNFISRNRQYTDRVLNHLSIDPVEFEISLDHFKKHISSIADLRRMWVDQDNKLAKVFRILSKEYLRKHSLSYIFNSRVTSINKHIKYRHKIEESIESPQDFTNMKEY